MVILGVAGISYAYWSFNATQKSVNVIGTDCLNIEMIEESEGISLLETHPISNEEGMKLTPYTFTIKNTCNSLVDYTINLESMEIDERLDSHYVAVSFDDQGINVLANYDEARPMYQDNDYTGVESRVLLKGYLDSKESSSHTLRIWMDEASDEESMDKNFVSKIVVSGTPNTVLATSPDVTALNFMKNGDEIKDLSSTNGFVYDNQVTINCAGDKSQCYIKVSKDVDITGSILKKCSADAPYLDCQDVYDFSSLEAGVWYRTSRIITFKSKEGEHDNPVIEYLSCVGDKCTDGTEVTLANIDRVAPSLEVVRTPSSTNSASIVLNASDSDSGLQNVVAKFGESPDAINQPTIFRNDEYVLEHLSNNKTYYYEIVALDKVGNVTTVTGSLTTKDLALPEIVTEYQDKEGNRLDQTTNYSYLANVSISFSDSNQHFVRITNSVSLPPISNITCGNGDLPGACSENSTSETQDVWYKVDGNQTLTFDQENNQHVLIKAISYDGVNYSDVKEVTLPFIDRTAPSLTLNTAVTSSNSISVPLATNDASGIKAIACVYGTDSNYGTNASSVNTGNCSLTNLRNNTTYYYQVTVEDFAGNKTIKTGSAKTGDITKPTVTMTGYNKSNASISAQNGYFYKETAGITFNTTNVSNPSRYIKSSVAGTSNVTLVQSCGTGTNPGACTNTSGTSMAANTWYKVNDNVTITYENALNSTGTVYAVLYDGVNFSTSGTGTISKIDRTAPSATIDTPTKTTATANIPITTSDNESQVSGVTCKYGTNENNLANSGTIKNQYDELNANGKIIGATKENGYVSLDGTDDLINLDLANQDFSNGQTLAIKFRYKGSDGTSKYILANIEQAGTGFYYRGNGELVYELFYNEYHIFETKVVLKENTDYTVIATYDNHTVKIYVNGIMVNSSEFEGTIKTSTAPYVIGANPSPSLNFNSDYANIDVYNAAIYNRAITESEITSDDIIVTNNTNLLNFVDFTHKKSNCSLTNLNNNTTYYYQIVVTDNVGNQTAKTGSVTTGTMSIPSVTINGYNKDGTKVDAQNGYHYKVVAAVSFSASDLSSSAYYVKSTSATVSNIDGYACGTASNPSTCGTSATKSFAADTWYKVSSNLNLTYETENSNNATVYAIVWDGTKFSSTGTGTVSKIDRTAPTGLQVTNPTNGNWTNQHFSVVLESQDSKSGIEKYAYSYDNSSWTYYSNSASTSFTTTNFAQERNQLAYFRVCDKLNNCSSSISTQVKLDTSAPTFSLGTVSVDKTTASVPVNSINADISGQKSLTCTGAGACSCSGSVCKATGLTSGTSYTMTITLTDNATNTTSKTVTFKTESDLIFSQVSVGQYVKYKPSKSSYSISTSLTGYSSYQTINPSELDLWRVIRKNSDGSIDLVSEYLSSKSIAFEEKEGYKKYIGTLNTIASQYETSGITSGSRYMGYNGQTQNITDETALNKTSDAAWTSSTTASNSPKGSIREAQGGGDTLYETDTDLVRAACGNTLIAKESGALLNREYWLASRFFEYYDSDNWSFEARNVDRNGDVKVGMYYWPNNSFNVRGMSYLRPIVTLKAGIQASSGDGTKSNPWKVN